MNLSFVKALLLLLGGFVMICIGIYITIIHIKFSHFAEQTTGKIIDIQSSRTVKGTNLYYPVVSYQPLNHERLVKFTAKPGVWSWLYSAGEEVNIIYSPTNPYDAKIKSFWMLWFLPLILVLLGVICLFASWHTWQNKT